MFGGAAGLPTIPLPGGYCTKKCDVNAGHGECGPTAGCISHQIVAGMGSITLSFCAPPCKLDKECRQAEGYRCNVIPLFNLGYCGPAGP
jgi:hypothetical protein